MITSNVIHRVFRIRSGESAGTAFTIDVQGRQYLITARHVVSEITERATLGVLSNGDWQPLDVVVVGHSAPEFDISVLAASRQLTPSGLPVTPTSADLTYGQEVFFLGFPYNFSVNLILGDEGFPMPFVKRATVSCFDGNIFYLDGHNNPGFSGAPVVFGQPGRLALNIAAVVSAFEAIEEPVFEDAQPTNLRYRYNTGLIVSHNIRFATELIDANPIGLEIA